tara:strand:- start:296 stop:445 length:150 start_codon:yes stop_codon:yes gene_type:complete
MDLQHGLLFLFLSVGFTLTCLSIGFYFYTINQKRIKEDKQKEEEKIPGL